MTRCVKLLCAALAALVAAPASAAPTKGGDPVVAGTVWKGKLTQKGEYMGMAGAPPEFDCEFTVTKRDGERFEAELSEKTDALKLTYLVRGTVKPVDKDNKDKGYKVEFESVGAKDVENTEALIKIPYSATLVGKKLKGTWKFPENTDNTTLEGAFEFELTKKE